MWLEVAKWEKLLTILKSWVRMGKRGTAGIPFKEYESVVSSCITHSSPSRQGWDYFLRVIECSKHDHHTSIFTEIRRYSMHCRDVACSFKNQHRNLQDAKS